MQRSIKLGHCICNPKQPQSFGLAGLNPGNNSGLRANITAFGLTSAAGILSTTTVWALGARPLPAKTWTGHGQAPKLMRRDNKRWPMSVKALALGVPKQQGRTI